MNYTNLIDICQAHLPVQYASDIKLIRQKRHLCCDWQRATPDSHVQNEPLVCSIDRLAPVLKTIFHQCVISYTYSQFNSGGSVLRATRVRLATSIWYDTLMKNCFKDWSQSTPLAVRVQAGCSVFPFYTPTKTLIRLYFKYKTVLIPKLKIIFIV